MSVSACVCLYKDSFFFQRTNNRNVVLLRWNWVINVTGGGGGARYRVGAFVVVVVAIAKYFYIFFLLVGKINSTT